MYYVDYISTERSEDVADVMAAPGVCYVSSRLVPDQPTLRFGLRLEPFPKTRIPVYKEEEKKGGWRLGKEWESNGG